MNSRRAELLMAVVTLAWGSSYLLMKVGLEGISPFNLIALRFGIAFLTMMLFFFPRFRGIKADDLGKGFLTGTLLFLIFAALVVGVSLTTASTAGFLASTTVVIVPILEALIRRKLPGRNIMLSILLAVIGLYLLTVKEGLALDRGAAYCLLAAFVYAVYIIVFDRIAKQGDSFLISIIQLGVAALLGAGFMLAFETPKLPETGLQWGAMLGLGIVCSAFGFVAQPLAQRYTSSEKIGLIFSLEPVFSALLSYIFLREILSGRGYVGAALIFAGVVYSQLAGVRRLARLRRGVG